METKGKSVRLYLPVYYCLDLEHIQKETYLLPEDYDYLMSTLQYLINSGFGQGFAQLLLLFLFSLS